MGGRNFALESKSKLDGREFNEGETGVHEGVGVLGGVIRHDDRCPTDYRDSGPLCGICRQGGEGEEERERDE